MEEEKKGIGLFGLIGLVVSSCIGSGVFALTGQIGQVAAPGSALVAWGVVGVGFLALALSFANLGAKRADLHGIFSYAEEGFGKFSGFISGWGYWLSAWLGNVAFATILMSTLGFFLPYFLPGNNIGSIVVASEGAMVVSARARKKSEAGKATVIGLVVLLLVYVGASVLPFGYMPYAEIGALDKPAMLYVFESMAPGWGGAFISVALIIAVLGSWLSFTILPSETTSLMAKHELLPPVFNRLNKKGSPQISLIVVGACTQAFMITLLFTEDAYNFAFSMCTVAIVITWAFAAAYQVKFSAQHHEWGQCAIGIVAVAFQVVGVLFNGWSFLLLTCVGYIPGFFFYWRARKEAGAKALTMGEKVGMGAISALGVLSLVLLAMGVISF